MPSWNSPEELERDARVFNNLLHAMAGLYIWEFVCSLDFDWEFVSGRRKFKWPFAFYFLGRYGLLASQIGVLVAMNVQSKVDCQGLYTFSQFTGDAAVGFASINLALRVIAIYKSDVRLISVLVLFILGHWAVIFGGISLEAVYVPGTGCVIVKTKAKMIMAVFIYSMGFDAIIITLSTIKLAFPYYGRSQLVRMLFTDGLLYFIIAFVANTIATTFMILNLNPVMSVMFNVPAVIASTIAASRCVRHLSTWTNPNSAQYSHPSLRNAGNDSFGMRIPTFNKRATMDGVHVKMETITQPDGTPELPKVQSLVFAPARTRSTGSDHDGDHARSTV
jgi:hypothetical protein